MAGEERLYIDLLRDVSLTERAGETIEARRVAVLTGVSAIPSIMENAKMFPYLPLAGDVLDAETDPEVILEDRSFTIVSWDGDTRTAKVRVELLYRRQRDEPVASLRGGTAVEQITSEVDKNGAALFVEHGGNKQGGHITVLTPRSTWVTESVEEVDDPNTVTKEWLGKVNSVTWGAAAPKTWLIVRADWERVDAFSRPRVYQFTWEFEYRAETWDPITIAYKDPQTGERPVPLDDSGIKDVEWYDTKDFSLKFHSGARR